MGVILNGALLGLVALSPKKLLTGAGIAHAWLLGVIIWGGLGWQGYAIVAAYFLVGSGVTRVGMARKEALGIAEKRSGARGPENVWGSGLVGALCTLGYLLLPDYGNLWQLAYLASFSTKLADTCASEVGKAYGRHTILITTLQPVPKGTEGAVSLEGTAAGVLGSLGLASLGWGVGLVSPWGVGCAVGAAFVATNLESVIGATLQQRFGWLTNEVVNVLNTLVGAVAAVTLVLALNLGV